MGATTEAQPKAQAPARVQAKAQTQPKAEIPISVVLKARNKWHHFESLEASRSKEKSCHRALKTNVFRYSRRRCSPQRRSRCTTFPNIRDTQSLIDILSEMGVKVTLLGEGSYTFQADDIQMDFLESEAYRKKASAIRGVYYVARSSFSPLQASQSATAPAEIKLGRRHLDTHFNGFRKTRRSLHLRQENRRLSHRCLSPHGRLCTLRRSLRHRHSQYRHGGCISPRQNDPLQRRLRALCAAAMPPAQPNGR